MKCTSMDAGVRGWVVTTAAAHFWRVAHWMEFEDLIQDGAMVWCRVVEKYECDTGRVRSRPHLMQLFKRSYQNHIHYLSKQKFVSRVEVLVEDEVVRRGGVIRMSDQMWDHLGVSHDVGEYDRLVAEAPGVIRPLLRVLFNGQRALGWSSEHRVYGDGTRETLNAKLCRLVGVDPELEDLATPLRAYLHR